MAPTPGSRRSSGPQTEVVDLAGKMVLPGFIDSHMHSPEGAVLPLFEVSLPEGCRSRSTSRPSRRSLRPIPTWPPIRGAGWDDSYFSLKGPRKEQLDEAVPDRPAVIRSCSFHSLWCNSKALELAGITKDTPSPPTASSRRTRRPASRRARCTSRPRISCVSKLPDYSTDPVRGSVRRASRRTSPGPCGITSCFDARFMLRHGNAMEAIAQLESEGKLSVRMRGGLYIDPAESMDSQLDQAVAIREQYARSPFPDEDREVLCRRLRLQHLPAEPFTTVPPGYRGRLPRLPRLGPGRADGGSGQGGRAGLPAALPCHRRRRGTDVAWTRSRRRSRRWGRRTSGPPSPTCSSLDEADLQRLADLRVVAVLQPVWMYKDPYYYQGYLPQLGEERCARMMPLKSLFDRGILVASSTDFPITNPPSPLDGIAIGTLRWHPLLSAPGDVWTPAERAACPADDRELHHQRSHGQLYRERDRLHRSRQVGRSRSAEREHSRHPAERIGFNWMGGGTAKVLMTMFQGKTVYRANDLS